MGFEHPHGHGTSPLRAEAEEPLRGQVLVDFLTAATLPGERQKFDRFEVHRHQKTCYTYMNMLPSKENMTNICTYTYVHVHMYISIYIYV